MFLLSQQTWGLLRRKNSAVSSGRSFLLPAIKETIRTMCLVAFWLETFCFSDCQAYLGTRRVRVDKPFSMDQFFSWHKGEIKSFKSFLRHENNFLQKETLKEINTRVQGSSLHLKKHILINEIFPSPGQTFCKKKSLIFGSRGGDRNLDAPFVVMAPFLPVSPPNLPLPSLQPPRSGPVTTAAGPLATAATSGAGPLGETRTTVSNDQVSKSSL